MNLTSEDIPGKDQSLCHNPELQAGGLGMRAHPSGDKTCSRIYLDPQTQNHGKSSYFLRVALRAQGSGRSFAWAPPLFFLLNCASLPRCGPFVSSDLAFALFRKSQVTPSNAHKENLGTSRSPWFARQTLRGCWEEARTCHGRGLKNRYPKWVALVSGNMDQNPRNPSCLWACVVLGVEI